MPNDIMKPFMLAAAIPTNVTDVGCVTVVEHQLSSNVDVIPQEMRQEENLNALSVVSIHFIIILPLILCLLSKDSKFIFESCRLYVKFLIYMIGIIISRS